MFPRRSSGARSIIATVVLTLLVAIGVPVVTAAPAVAADENEIVTENARPGNPPSEWDVAGAGDPSIQGFATDISVDQGQTISFKIDTPATDFRIDIYRLGWYGGAGAREVATVEPSTPLPQVQPACSEIDGTTNDNLIDCGNWGVSASWAVPSDAVSGIYIARPVREDVGGDLASHIAFIVRDDNGNSDLLFQTSDTTWQAYNGYGGYSLYANPGHAHKVSYNRPFTTRQNPTEDWLFNAEYPMLRWLERNGYDVSYFTDVDADRLGTEILEHTAFLSVGHDEYWSAAQRANVEAARDAGVHLAFFSGNEVYWKTRWEPSTADGGSTDHRTLVSYKEGDAQGSEHYDCQGNFDCDPHPTTWTGLWRQNQTGHDGGRPENALSGQISWGDTTTAIQVPASATGLRFWRNAGMTSDTTLTAGTLGYEFDWEQPAYAASNPPGRITVSDTTAVGRNHKMSLYRAPSGALVFGAGTVQWSWGLDGTHDRGGSTEDPRMQQATVNLLSDMEAQPATLQSGLVAGGALDTTAPTATITDPAGGATVPGGNITISGTAADVGGVVAAVEVSTDGGTTWGRATGTTNWTYTFSASNGEVTAQARAVDDAATIGTAASVTFTAAAQTCPCTIFTPSTTGTQENDPAAVELGVKFRSDVAGFVTGIRFFKTAGNTGTHTGRLWTTAGANLGTVTFTSESATGWQEATFSSPIAVTANTTYVASYHTTSGNYATGTSFASAGVDNPPLHALQGGVDGPNGVYQYGAGGTYPTTTFGSSNYLVDVVFATDVGPDLTPPTIIARSPGENATGVAVGSNVTVTFSEPMDAATITSGTVELRDAANTLVAATVTYDSGARRVTLDPTASLATSTIYTATVEGGAPGVKDVAGNALATDSTWSFTVEATPTSRPDPNVGPGGPVLVVKGTGPFGSYLPEIMRAEGLNLFTVGSPATLTEAGLTPYETVVLGETTLTGEQVTALTDWVTAGGNLVALRPDPALAGLLGLTTPGGTLAEGYIQVDTATSPGAGIVGETMQYHGTADLYTAQAGTQVVATLFSNATTATANPAVTLRSVGTAGGSAAAFTYDLARSIVLTRQGNPAWINQNRDGQSGPNRGDDLFYGNASFDPQPDYVDLSKVAIPQADEQQRLLANVVTEATRDALPLPRFWYLPRGEVAAIVMTADEHNGGDVPARLEIEKAASPLGCAVDDWACIRSTSYLYPNYPSMSATQASQYDGEGFEIALHPNTNCESYSRENFANALTTQLAALAAAYPGVQPSATSRNHCIAWTDYTTVPEELAQQGIHLDTNYYYWPPGWVNDVPGMFTGSGFPQRFATTGGALVDVYQATTQMTDESGQTYPKNAATLMDNAINLGYYGVFVANLHTDGGGNAAQNHQATLQAAAARDVPVISAEQLLSWTDGRNASSFQSLTRTGNSLTFTIAVGAGANGLQAMLPIQGATGALQTLTRDASPVSFTTRTIKGVEYAVFGAGAGAYAATYDVDTTAPVISNVGAVSGADGTATITWSTDEPATSRVDYGTSAASLTSFVEDTAPTTSHEVVLTGLAPNTTYYFRVTSVDGATNASVSPDPPAAPATFTTPTAVATDTTVADFSAGTTGASTYVADTAGGEVILAPTVGAEFGGTSLPAGWESGPWTAGSAAVAGGSLSVDGAYARTTSLYDPGHVLEFRGTFANTTFHNAGLAFDFDTAARWAAFGIGNASGQLYARVNNGSGEENTPLGAGYFGSPHTYRIEWTATQVRFYVDGTLVHTSTQAITGQMRPIVSDYTAGSPTLAVDWLRMTPYTSPGTFLSRIHSAGSPAADWGTFSYVADVPSGTTLAFEVRTGETLTPDGTWTPFAPIVQGGDVTTSGRYLQYRVTATSTTGEVTPTLESVTLPYTAAPDTDPPGITGRTPAPDATDVPVDANVTVTFDEPMNPATITTSTVTLRAQGAGADVPATVSYSGLTATLDPSANLANGTAYTVTVAGTVADAAGTPLGAPDTWTFTTVPVPTYGCPCSVWGPTATPANPAVTDNQPIEVGVKIRAEIDGWITGVRFYKGTANTGTHVGHLWSSTGQQLAEATFTSETPSGWQQVDFATPVAVTAGTTYVASYHSSSGYFAIDAGYFSTTGVNNPPLQALQAGVDGPNGVYKYGASGFPDGGNTANYWVDVVFEEPDTVAPTITTRAPDQGATGVGTNTNVTLTFSERVAAASVTSSSVRLRAEGAGSDVPATRSVNGAAVVLDPTADLDPYTSYTVTVTTDVTDRFGNPLAGAASWSFTTGGITSSLVDTTVADFGAGTTGASTYVANTAGGEVILTPTVGEEFDGTSLPTGWSVKDPPWTGGGTATVADGRLSVDGTMAGTTATFGPGRSLEFVATFSAQPFQHVGFVADLAFNNPWAIVSTGSSGDGVYARTSSGANDALGAGLLGAAHRYRIDWTATGFDFYVDGTFRVTIDFATAGPMLVGASDVVLGLPVVVDWLRLSPYAASGTFESRLFDAGTKTDWTTLTTTTIVPNGTAALFETRTGRSTSPGDGTWSPWAPVSGGTIASPNARYLQYRALLSTTDAAITPVVERVEPTAMGLPPNQAPVAVADGPYGVAAGATLVVPAGTGVLANDTDPDLDLLEASVLTEPSYGLLALAPDGSFTFEAFDDYQGSDSFTYRVTDDRGASATATVTLTISDETPPEIVIGEPAAGTTVQPGATITVQGVAGDLGGSGLQTIEVRVNTGSWSLATGTFPWTATVTAPTTPGSFTISARATDNAGNVSTEASVTATVATLPSLPAPWVSSFVGSGGPAGSASVDGGGVWSVSGGGANIAGSADAFRFVYQEFSGDVDVVARVGSMGPLTSSWAKAGVMIRESLTAGSPHVSMVARPGLVPQVISRSTPGGTSTLTDLATPVGVPRWVRVVRSGNVFSVYQSTDGSAWTLRATRSVTMGASVYVGLAVTSNNTSQAITATFTNVAVGVPANVAPQAVISGPTSAVVGQSVSFDGTGSVDPDGTVASYSWETSDGQTATGPTASFTFSPAGTYQVTLTVTDDEGATGTATQAVVVTAPLPAPWVSSFVGSGGPVGSASVDGAGVWSVSGGGANIAGSADAFRFVYQEFSGDVDVVARVGSMGPLTSSWAKAGVMIRESLTAGSPHVSMVARPGLVPQVISRSTPGGTSTLTDLATPVGVPRWVRVVRSGNVFSVYQSTDGSAWTLRATRSVTMGASVYVGLAVTSNNTSQAITATFTNVTVGVPANVAPQAVISGPTSAVVGQSVSFDGTGSVDPDGTVASYSWETSDGQTATGPTASFTFSPAGTYQVTLTVTDDDSATGTATQAVVVTAPLPAPWVSSFVGSGGPAGSASVDGAGLWSVSGGGANIAGSADAFRFVYQEFSGDVDVVARVGSMGPLTSSWAKAGVMIRESLTAGSPHVSMVARPGLVPQVISRSTPGGTSTLTDLATPVGVPRWVRVVRSGNVFSVYQSTDGSAWTLRATRSVTMGASVYVGLAVTSNNTSQAITATFTNVTVGVPG